MTKKQQLDEISLNFRKKMYASLDESMSKYNSRDAEKYFRQVDDILVLVQDIKRWLTEAVDQGGVDLADDLLKDLKKEISKISKSDY